MTNVTKYYRLAWLEKYGRFITNPWLTANGDRRITWEAYGGLMLTGGGETMESMYDDMYRTIKEDLYKRCLK